MTNVNIELEEDVKEYIEALAEQMGVSVGEWCVAAITQQLMVHEAMNNMFSDIEEIFMNPQQLDLGPFKNLNDIIDITDMTKKLK